MRMPRFLTLAVLAAACSTAVRKDATPPLSSQAPQAAAAAAATTDSPVLTQAEMIEHVLDRTTFGPRAIDRRHVREEGISAFLEEQLHPEQLEDAAVSARLATFEVLNSSPDALVARLYKERKKKQQEKRQEEMLAAAPGAPAGEPKPAEPMARPRAVKRDYVQQLSQAKLLRAVSSDRQLQEVMVDFWFNHFNVFSGKADEAALLPEYESKALRANALGTFPELLEAVAHSPAMLVYLDNWRSAVPKPKAKQQRGINENYARELLELHTLGVDGGYSQQDVIEVARCFTGWTVGEPRTDPRFLFKKEMHDFGQKIVLGHLIPAGGGIEDGSQVLHILETHPATARFLAGKLIRRFVSDDPPDALVSRVASTYTATGGDIRSMLRTIFESPEFWSRKALRAKVRSPLELVTASTRALNASVADPLQLAKAVARIGQPLYGAQPPTGYADVSQTWLSSGALLARIDFGLSLASGQVEGVSVDLSSLGGGPPEQVLTRAAATLGANALSDKTRDYILQQLRQTPSKPDLQAARAVGLLLGAPELQRR
ncbi:MAG TPA: DUF1800 domain-containing protein [Myxococcales bacterium]|nr:DUF1800 domain-containing protein [Myxococcales bacterium]